MNQIEFIKISNKLNKLIENNNIDVNLNGHFDENDDVFLINKLPNFFMIDGELINICTELHDYQSPILTLFNKILNHEFVNPFPLALLNKSCSCPSCKKNIILWIDHEKIFIKEDCKKNCSFDKSNKNNFINLEKGSTQSILEHSYIKLLEDNSSPYIYPSLSVLLSELFLSFEIDTDIKAEFPTMYYDYSTNFGYMDIVKQKKILLNILDDKKFFDAIPLLDKETFMLSMPNSNFKYHQCFSLNDSLSPWTGVYYPYDINIQDLIFILILFKSMLEYQDSKAINEMNSSFIEKILFSLDMAYNNIIERDLKDVFYKHIEELNTSNVWDNLKGYSQSLKYRVNQNQKLNALRLHSLGLLDKKDFESWIEKRTNQVINNWINKKE